MRRPDEKFTTHPPSGSAGNPSPTFAPELFEELAAPWRVRTFPGAGEPLSAACADSAPGGAP
jgi:hypothetical protein